MVSILTSIGSTIIRKFSSNPGAPAGPISIFENIFNETAKGFDNEDGEYTKIYPMATVSDGLEVFALNSEQEEKIYHLVLSVQKGKKKKRTVQYSLFRNENSKEVIVRCEQLRPHAPLFQKVPTGRAAFAWLNKVTRSLQEHPMWRSCHIAALHGITDYFVEHQSEINESSIPEGLTPIAIAVREEHQETIDKLISLGAHGVDIESDDEEDSLYEEEENEMTNTDSDDSDDELSDTDEENDCFEMDEGKLSSASTFSSSIGSRRSTIGQSSFRRKLSTRSRKISVQSVRSSVISMCTNPFEESLIRKETGLDEMQQILEEHPGIEKEIDIPTGNTPLHIVQHKRSLLSLLELMVDELNVNARNKFSEAPLHVYAQNRQLGLMVALYGYWADVNVKNGDGNTPLHIAVMNGDVQMVKLLVCIGADVNMTNNHLETPRHLASKNTENAEDLLYVLCVGGARTCDVSKSGCSPQCIHPQHQAAWAMHDDITIDSNSVENFDDEYTRMAEMMSDPYKYKTTEQLRVHPEKDEDISHINSLKHLYSALSKLAQNRAKRDRIVNLLALDGGGVKGFVLVQILLSLEQYLDQPLGDYFDWIAATSTGSCVGANATIKNCVREGQRIYLRFKDDVFGQRIRPYNPLILEKFYQKVFGKNRTLGDVRGVNHYFCTATQADTSPAKLVLMRNYDAKGHSKEYGEVKPEDTLIWRACRRSCAAPTYFPASEERYVDGGLMSNNPTLDLLSEIHHWNTSCDQKDRVRVGCVLSVGTGLVEAETVEASQFEMNGTLSMLKGMKNLLQMVTGLVTATDGPIITRSRAWTQSIGAVFYRLNPPLKKNYAMDTIDDNEIIEMMWDCVTFSFQQRKLLEELAEVIMRIGPSERSGTAPIQKMADESLEFVMAKKKTGFRMAA